MGFGEALRIAGELAGIPRPEFGRSHASGPAVGDEPAWRSVIRGRSTEELRSCVRRPNSCARFPRTSSCRSPGGAFRSSIPVRKRSISMSANACSHLPVGRQLDPLPRSPGQRPRRPEILHSGWMEGQSGRDRLVPGQVSEGCCSAALRTFGDSGLGIAGRPSHSSGGGRKDKGRCRDPASSGSDGPAFTVGDGRRCGRSACRLVAGCGDLPQAWHQPVQAGSG